MPNPSSHAIGPRVSPRVSPPVLPLVHTDQLAEPYIRGETSLHTDEYAVSVSSPEPEEPDYSSGRSVSAFLTCPSPSSFRLQIERLASEYESLYGISQTLFPDGQLLQGNGDIHAGEAPPHSPYATEGRDRSPSVLQLESLKAMRNQSGDSLSNFADSAPPNVESPCQTRSSTLFAAAASSIWRAPRVRNESRIVGSSSARSLPEFAFGSPSVTLTKMSALRSVEVTRTMSETSCPGFHHTSLGGSLFPKWFDPGSETDLPDEDFELHDTYQSVQDEGPADRCTISPISPVRLSWDFCVFAFLLAELWITPFELIFLEKCDTPSAFSIFSHFITAFFSCDIMLNFFTGFVEGDKTVMSGKRIFWHYLRFWFWLDLVATVPFELFVNEESMDTFSGAKLGKASKAAKTLRYLKLLRVMRLVKLSQQVSNVTAHFQVFSGVRHVLAALQVTLALAIFAHIHGCVWAALQPVWVAVDDPATGLDRYFESFWWAYTAVTAGSVGYAGVRQPRTHSGGILLLEMLIASERLALGVLGTMRVMFRSLRFIDEARLANSRMEVLTYLRKNKVSFQTQIQVLFCLTDTTKARRQQRFFDTMSQENLPRELRRTICGEIWSGKLLTLGMIVEISSWHPDFILELSQLVSEEVHPSRVVLFRVGEAAVAAYHIVEGEISIRHAQTGRPMPNFKVGMWVGENALASSLLRRSATCTTKAVTTLMVVGSDSFHETLSHLGLMEKFQTFCGEQLWRGLCGRCGDLGDHFSDRCPHLMPRMSRGSFGRLKIRDTIEAGPSRRLSARRESSTTSGSSDPNTFLMSRELRRYLAEIDLTWIGSALRQLGIFDLSDLESLDLEELQRILEADLSPAQKRALSSADIRQFRERQASGVHKALFHQVSRLHHLMFLSHYKLEAGTEAALLRTEIEQAIAKDPGSLGHRFEQPVFLDSDDLSNLEDLQQRVCHTHNLVLLLTKGVLTRPWCIVEILTAWKEGVRIQPVIITKPGNEFVYPDEAFYANLRGEGGLDAQALECVKQHGYSIEQVELAFRSIFQQIAVPYSPHKASNIRQAEVDKLMKNCRLKSEVGAPPRSTTREFA